MASLGHLELLMTAADRNLAWFPPFIHWQSLLMHSYFNRTDWRLDILWGLSDCVNWFLLSGIGKKREHLLLVLDSSMTWFSLSWAVVLRLRLALDLSRSSKLIDLRAPFGTGVSVSITDTLKSEIIGVLISKLSSCALEMLLTSWDPPLKSSLQNKSWEMFFSSIDFFFWAYWAFPGVFARPTEFAFYLYFVIISFIFWKLSSFGFKVFDAESVFLWWVVWWVFGLCTDFYRTYFGPSLYGFGDGDCLLLACLDNDLIGFDRTDVEEGTGTFVNSCILAVLTCYFLATTFFYSIPSMTSDFCLTWNGLTVYLIDFSLFLLSMNGLQFSCDIFLVCVFTALVTGWVELNLLSFLTYLFSFVDASLLFLTFFGSSFSLGLTFEIAFAAWLLNVAVAIKCC